MKPETTAKPIYCPRRRQHNAECETPNACAGGVDCRLGPDLNEYMNDRPSVSNTTRRRAPERATIDPPPEHVSHPYHWAYNCRSPGGFLVYEARGGKLWHSLGHSLNAETLYEKGWRYLGPAIPPTVKV